MVDPDRELDEQFQRLYRQWNEQHQLELPTAIVAVHQYGHSVGIRCFMPSISLEAEINSMNLESISDYSNLNPRCTDDKMAG